MGNMKFDGADVTFELDGYDALVERVRSKKVNCKINPSDLPRLYAVMDAELEGNEELAAAFAEAQEAAFGEAVLAEKAERGEDVETLINMLGRGSRPKVREFLRAPMVELPPDCAAAAVAEARSWCARFE